MGAPDLFALEAVHELVEHFDALGVPYLVGGSMASIVWGEPRMTLDVDLVANLEDRHAAPLAERLADGWYVQVDDIRDAVKRRRSFNVIRYAGMVKIDVFVPVDEGHHAAKWMRARRVAIGGTAMPELLVTAPEDIVLQKLVRFRSGGEVSEQQWRDVTALLRVQAGRLDEPYLHTWAVTLGVDDLLARARAV